MPDIESERLESLDDQTFWDMMDRERRIVDWALENEAIINEVCK